MQESLGQHRREIIQRRLQHAGRETYLGRGTLHAALASQTFQLRRPSRDGTLHVARGKVIDHREMHEIGPRLGDTTSEITQKRMEPRMRERYSGPALRFDDMRDRACE